MSHLESTETQEVIVSYKPEDAADILLCRQILDKLNQHYSGHMWHVKADHRTGVATIILLYTNAQNQVKPCGVLMHINNLNSDPGLLAVMRYGGELLERFGLPRTKAQPDACLVARTNVVDLGGMKK